MLNEKVHTLANATGATSVVSGVGTFMGGVMGWLNEYGVAIGAICAALTCVANYWFKRIEARNLAQYRAKMLEIEEARKA